MDNNVVTLEGQVKSELETFTKDGVHYGSFLIEAKSKYEMTAPIIKCIFAGPVLEKANENIKINDYINLKAHLIMEDGTIEVIVDEIN